MSGSLPVRVCDDGLPFSDGDPGAVDPDHAGSVGEDFPLPDPDSSPVRPGKESIARPVDTRRKKCHR